MIATLETRHPPPISEPTPNEIADQLIGRDYLSYSSISTYQRCPLKFFFNYVLGLAPEFVSSNLVFGGAIHAAIELHCQRLMEGEPPPSIDELMAIYEKQWEDESRAPVKFGKNESVESLRELARRMLSAFQASKLFKMNTSILAIEEEFRSPIALGCPDLLGRLDLLTLSDITLRIIDFKTSRSKWNQAKVAESAPQMLLYSKLVHPLARDLDVKNVQIEWIVLTKTKQPVVESHSLAVDPQQIKRVTGVFARVWEAISSGHFYPSPSSMNCAACPHRTACQQWEG